MTQELPSVGNMFAAFTGYQRTFAMKAAIDLDVFTAVGEGATTVPALAARCKAAERGIRSLCNRLVVDGFLTREGEDYGLSMEAGLFLDRRSPAFLGSMVTFLTEPTILKAFASLTDAVRRGGTALDAAGSMAPDHPMWVEFARAMAPAAAMGAEGVSAVLGPVSGSVLDVAAGHGCYGLAIVRNNPGATVVALDWANVLAVAQENADKAGLADRFSRRPGSAFDTDWGTGHALVLLTNFLHHFDPATCETLLRRAHAALAPGGRVVAVEMVPDENRLTPPEAAAFSLVMLASTQAGDAWTHAEYTQMFRNAGYGAPALHDLPPTPQRALIAAK